MHNMQLGILCILSCRDISLNLPSLLVQLQQDSLWSKWVDMAFQKLDSNGDGFLDLEEIISQLPVEDAENVTTRRERLLEVRKLPVLQQPHKWTSSA